MATLLAALVLETIASVDVSGRSDSFFYFNFFLGSFLFLGFRSLFLHFLDGLLQDLLESFVCDRRDFKKVRHNLKIRKKNGAVWPLGSSL